MRWAVGVQRRRQWSPSFSAVSESQSFPWPPILRCRTKVLFPSFARLVPSDAEQAPVLGLRVFVLRVDPSDYGRCLSVQTLRHIGEPKPVTTHVFSPASVSRTLRSLGSSPCRVVLVTAERRPENCSAGGGGG